MELNTARDAHSATATEKRNQPKQAHMVQGEFYSQKMRIHAGLMNQEDQEDFAFRAFEKVMHLLINEGVEPEFALAGLQAFTETYGAV